MRILVVFGTRPEIIKLGPVIRALREKPGMFVSVFWTGQHLELATGLLDLFDIEVEHNGSKIMSEPGLGGKYGLITRQTEDLLRNGSYDLLIVQGDTTTAAAAATAGFLNHVPVAHVEAGLRTDNLYSPWPEEFNRRIITIAASLHFPPTQAAQSNLLSEGIREADAPIVGNTVVDALQFARNQIQQSGEAISPEIARIPIDKKLVLCTLHRRENIGPPMRAVLGALADLAADGDKTIALPVHMNPEVRTEVMRLLGGTANVHLLPPLQYLDFVYLLARCWVVVSELWGSSGGSPHIWGAHLDYSRYDRTDGGRRSWLRPPRRRKSPRHRRRCACSNVGPLKAVS